MKILILSDAFPPDSSGGADRIAYNLTNGLKQKGHKVFVVTTTQNKNKSENGENGIYRIYTPKYHERWRAYLSLYNPKIIKEFKKIIKEIKPDIVHAHNIHYYLSFAALKTAKKYSRAIFLTAHDVIGIFHYGKLVEFIDKKNLSIPKDFNNYKVTCWQQIKRFKRRYNPLRNIIIRHYLRYIDRIFAVSQALKNALNQNGIQNVVVIHNGIDVRRWHFNQDETEKFKKKYNLANKKIVLFAGRISGLKGGGKIIEIMQQVICHIPEATLLVAGKKEDASNILKSAQSKAIPIVFTDWIPESEMRAAYWNSHLVVVPSFYLDPFPTINLEAMACKRPVVGTCFGGTPELVLNNTTGYIVNPYNINMVAQKIIDLLKNPETAEQFGKNGFERIEKYFNLDIQVKKYLQEYKK